MNWHGIAFGAEQSWNSAEELIPDYESRFSAAIYGDRRNRIGAAINTISEIHTFLPVGKLYDKKFWEPVFPDYARSKELRLTRWDAVRDQVVKARQILNEAQTSTYSADLDFLDFGMRRVGFLARIRLEAVEAAAAYENACLNQYQPELAGVELRKAWQTVARLNKEMVALKADYQQLWLQENRIYWRDVILIRYDKMIRELADVQVRLEGAISDYEKGLPLLSPTQARLDITVGEDNYLSDWHLIGPFKADADYESWSAATKQMFATDYLVAADGEDGILTDFNKPVSFAGKKYFWKPYQTDRAALDLRLEFTENALVTAYAGLTLISDVDREIKALVGADDGLQVILNGEQIFEKRNYSGYHPGKEVVTLNLKAGSNQLMIKVVQSLEDWGFSVNLPEITVKKTGAAQFEIHP